MYKAIKLSCYALNIIFCALFIAPIFAASYNVRNEKVVICGVCKNVAHCLPNMKSKIESLGAHFKDYRIIIYENNSSDDTAKQLSMWAQKNPKVIVFSENLTAEQLHNRTVGHAFRDKAPCRMELIAYARNVVLKRAMAEDFADFNFLVMTDMDFNTGWDVPGVLSCFNIAQEWDCLAANSIAGGATYYDRYAYRDERFVFGPELLGEDFWQELGACPVQISPTQLLHPVYSAFGGVAVYKKNALQGCEYAGIVTPEFSKMMFLLLNYKIDKKHTQFRTYIKDKKFDGLVPVSFCPNSGYDSPVVCEHSTLHAAMALRGHDKIYVNSAMICRY